MFADINEGEKVRYFAQRVLSQFYFCIVFSMYVHGTFRTGDNKSTR